MSWAGAWLRSVLIVLFFVVATVWLPSWVLKLGPVAELGSAWRDIIGTAAWVVPLLAGMWGLRQIQRAGRI